eukprot:scaffold168360_cov43-Cyclotella_meneghiniana.AAC.1
MDVIFTIRNLHKLAAVFGEVALYQRIGSAWAIAHYMQMNSRASWPNRLSRIGEEILFPGY